MSDREKLMNMIRIGRACPGDRDPFGEHCEACCYFDAKECDVERLADHLLANGVTVRKTGRWIIHHEAGGRHSRTKSWAECSECRVCGSPQ